MLAANKKRWVIQPQIPLTIEQALADYPPVLKQLLYNRGYQTQETAYRYLAAEKTPGTEPMNMLGIPEAVDRIQYAIQRQENIAVYGDYDADGVTATALLVQFLENLGANVREYIPNRFDEGYGLNLEALAALKDEGINLVVTVDCGIRSPEEAAYAAQLGLDLIISDHHHPGRQLPNALAIINPKQENDTYPDKDLAGVGLAYKLAEGIVADLENHKDNLPKYLKAQAYLDLVAIGTVADMAPLVGENRYLVRQGMKLLQQPQRQGIQSLIGVSGVIARKINAWDIGFLLGPRLNAAGRLDSALLALKLLVSKDVAEASELAQILDNQNRERQELTRQMQMRAEELMQADPEPEFLIYADDPNFNPGLVGLVASRLTEMYYRPSIIAHAGHEVTRASCRSIPEFHITNALDQCADLLDHHGGHAAAAGFTVRNENLPELINRMKDIAQENLSGRDLQPSLTADMEIPLIDLKPEVLKFLEWLQPTGQGNPQAVFVSRGLKVIRARTVGKDNTHLKMAVSDGHITYDAIAFRQGMWMEAMPSEIDLIYTFESNEFNGRETLQLNVRDIQPSEG